MKVAGTFQFFYCTGNLAELPHPDVPTRDVTNTWKQGHKTEPHLEKLAENWCRCRALFVTAAVKRARRLAAEDGQHYLLLTTRHPKDRHPFVVGIMPFSKAAYTSLCQAHPGRWGEHAYLPYVSDSRLKLVRFADAFSLQDWLTSTNRSHIPGGQGGLGHVPMDLLTQVLDRFSTRDSHVGEFLENVRALEVKLATKSPAAWQEYQARLGHQGKSCGTPPVRALPRRCK